MTVFNYVYYRGGLFGDLIFSIINNGVHLPEWIQCHLKSSLTSPAQFKHFVLSLPLSTLTGCASEPLDWGLSNYEVVCTDKKINEWAVVRFTRLYPTNQLTEILKDYYPDQLTDSITKLTYEKRKELLVKKYQTVQYSEKVSKQNLLDVSCIFDKEKFISMLSNHFVFDHALADLQYNFWYQREESLMKQSLNP
jgi:hypothetical protein